MTDLALSIRQPWAWAIVYGGKAIENRDWRSRYTGRLLIHAAKTFDPDGYEWIEAAARAGAVDLGRPLPSPSEFLRGGVIGAVSMVACVESPYDDVFDVVCASHDLEWEARVEPWWQGPKGFVLVDPEPVRFKPCRGMPGLFRPGVAAR